MAERKLVIPKNPAAAADLWWKTRQERLAAEKAIEGLKERENALKEHLINTLPKSDLEGVQGKLVRVSIERKPIPVVQDWAKLYTYIGKHKAFHLLNKALNRKAAEEMLATVKKGIPGITTFPDVRLSYSAVKAEK